MTSSAASGANDAIAIARSAMKFRIAEYIVYTPLLEVR